MTLRKGTRSSPHVVACDYVADVIEPGERPGCGERFMTYSDRSVVERQIRIAGWSIPPVSRGDDAKHICPIHSVRISARMSRGIPTSKGGST